MAERKVLDFGDLPREDTQKDLKDQVAEIRRYLYKLREDLSFVLRNLSEENWNDAALKRLKESFADAAAVDVLTQKVDALTVAMSSAQGSSVLAVSDPGEDVPAEAGEEEA